MLRLTRQVATIVATQALLPGTTGRVWMKSEGRRFESDLEVHISPAQRPYPRLAAHEALPRLVIPSTQDAAPEGRRA